MKRTLFILVIAAMILSGCASLRKAAATEAPPAPPYYGAAPQAAQPEAPAESYAYPAPTMMPGASDQANSGGGVAAAPVERLVIQNADLAVVVADVQKRMKEIEVMAVDMGGFVVSSNIYQSYTDDFIEVPEATIVIRVPAERLDDALDLIKKDAVEVQNENRSGQDVTAEYVDLQSRLKNLEAAEAQLQEILKGATKTDDVVNIFNQLVYYREQIELVKGQMKYYEDAAALSAISVRLIPEQTVQPIKIAGWEPQGVARDAIQDLVRFLQDFVDFLIGFFLRDLWELLLIALPFYVVFLIARAIYRRLRANRRLQETIPPPANK